jgi:hypothetical protein
LSLTHVIRGKFAIVAKVSNAIGIDITDAGSKTLAKLSATIEGLTKTRTMSRARRNFCQGMSVENRSRAELACHKDGVTLWAQSMNCMHYAVISAKNHSAVSG